MATTPKFNVGDTVTLKSGGPVMTISKTAADTNSSLYAAHWFAGKKLENGHFRAEELLAAPPSAPIPAPAPSAKGK